MRNFLLILLAIFTVGCSGQRSTKSATNQPQRYRFSRVLPPQHLAPEQIGEWMADHYWDRFDFADTLIVERADSAEMMRIYAEYVATFVGPYNSEPIKKLMQRASVSRKMLDYFVAMSEKLFHDPNSPLRSDELYIPVLEAQIAAPFYDEYEKMVPEYDLALASQNRIMQGANDFRYTIASGRTSNLYSLKADFILIYINNPGCPMCRQIQEQLVASQIVAEALKSKRLKILAIYPDEDLTLWHQHPLPKEWINGYDKGRRLEKDRLYDLRAIPSLYLLDRDKKVLVKDSTTVPEIERMILEYQQ